MLLALLLLQPAIAAAAGDSASLLQGWHAEKSSLASGCDKIDVPFKHGVMETRSLTWQDGRLPTVSRKFHVYLPRGYTPGLHSNMVVHYHGYAEDALSYHTDHDWKRVADLFNMVMVYPEGMDDCEEKGAFCRDGAQGYKSWNAAGSTGFTGVNSTCDTEIQQYNMCYKSCKAKKGSCDACDWTHCYDDVAFTRVMLESVVTDYCIDDKRIFAAGCENGGQMVYDLVRELPDTFAAVAAMCGAKPHRGWPGLGEARHPVSFLISTGRDNADMPRSLKEAKEKFGLNWDGWKYEDEKSVVSALKKYNHCANPASMVKQTPFRKHDTRCKTIGFECDGDVAVVSCSWRGGSGMKSDDALLAAEFFLDHPRPKFERQI